MLSRASWQHDTNERLGSIWKGGPLTQRNDRPFGTLLALFASFRKLHGFRKRNDYGLLPARDFAASPPVASLERSRFRLCMALLTSQGTPNVSGCAARIFSGHKALPPTAWILSAQNFHKTAPLPRIAR